MMKVRINEREDKLEVALVFSDSRLVDLEFALLTVAQERRWELKRTDISRDHVHYQVSDGGTFLASIHFTHGLEPPTRVLIENRPTEADAYGPAHKKSTAAFAEAFLQECAARVLASDKAVAAAIQELERHAKAIA